MADKNETTNTTEGDVDGNVVQAQTISGIANFGGTNTVTNCAVGDGATVTVNEKD